MAAASKPEAAYRRSLSRGCPFALHTAARFSNATKPLQGDELAKTSVIYRELTDEAFRRVCGDFVKHVIMAYYGPRFMGLCCAEAAGTQHLEGLTFDLHICRSWDASSCMLSTWATSV